MLLFVVGEATREKDEKKKHKKEKEKKTLVDTT